MIGVEALIESEDRYVLKGFEIALITNEIVYDALYIVLAEEKKSSTSNSRRKTS
jgi:predicted nucleic acid-binding protein